MSIVFNVSGQQRTEELENNYAQIFDSSEYYLRINPNKSLTPAMEALEIARHLKDEEKLARVYLQIGIIYRLNGNLSKSEKNLNKALILGENFDFYPLILKETGINLKQQSRYYEALNYYLRALDIYQKKKQTADVATMHNNIGRLYFAMGDETKALTHYRKSLVIRVDNNRSNSAGISYHNIGAVMEKMNRLDSAQYYYRKALNIYQKSNDQILIAYGFASLGNIIENKDSAEYYLLKSYDIRNDLNLEADLLESLYFLGKFKMKFNQQNEAEEMFREVYNKSVKKNKLQYAHLSAKKLAEIYRNKKDYHNAYLYEKNASIWQDSLYLQEKKVKELGFEYRLRFLYQGEELKKLNTKNHNQQLQIRISNSQLEKERQLKFFWVTNIVLILSIALILLVYFIKQRLKNKELEIQKAIIEQKSKENEVLIREVHHRVKNNLHSVMSLLRLEKRKYKDQATDRLVENMENRIQNISFVHEILYNQDNLTSVHLNEYLNIIGRKILDLYPDKNIELQVKGDITVDSDTALYLGQLFSELYTNSCKHAFINCNSPKITLEIEYIEMNKCKITYCDNGSGIIQNSKNDSFGKKLIESHGRKLKAEIEEYNHHGYCCKVEFTLK